MNLQEAMEYNRAREALAKFSDMDKAKLVAFLQEFAPEEVTSRIVAGGSDLQVDGKFGPLSAAVLDESFRIFARAPAPAEAPRFDAMPAGLSKFAIELLSVCAREEGNGEVRFDNSGPHICRYRGLPDSYATKNLGAWHHWCAFSVGYMIREALKASGQPEASWRWMMFQDDNFNGKLMPIGGARDIVRRLASSKIGEWVAREGKILKALRPGDIVAIRYNGDVSEVRGAGHVFIIRTVDASGTKVTTWEGNLGPFPADWKSRSRDLLKLGGSAKLLQAARVII